MVQSHVFPPSSPDTAKQPDSPSLEDKLARHIHAVLALPATKEEDLPEEFRHIEKMEEVHALLWGIRKLAHALSVGELEHISKERGFIIGVLKNLQSNLRHITWQTQRIARGEYQHRVNFLGDFSVAFNQMAEQLDRTINNLTCISEEYKDLSHRDSLTGLYNRTAFNKFSEQLLLKNACMLQNSTLIMADIDKFKSINDTYGHLCGDQVLREFSQKLLSVLRSKDLCCRYGGEEFLILMPDTPLESGISIAERLRKAVEDMRIQFECREVRITASFGLSEIKSVDSEQSFEEYLKSRIQVADDNLYKAKSTGRNRIIH